MALGTGVQTELLGVLGTGVHTELFLVTLILVLRPGVLVTMAESIVGFDRPGAASIAAVFGQADTMGTTTVIGAKAIRPIGAGVSLQVFWLRRQLIPIMMLGSATITDSKCLLIIVLLPTACSSFGHMIQPQAPISAVMGIPIRARERWTLNIRAVGAHHQSSQVC